MSELLTVIAQIRARPGQEAPLRRQLRCLVGPTRAESGCIVYDLHESNTDPGLFVFYETWRAEADLDAHFQTPHMLEFQERIPELVDGSIEITKCTKL
jgi:quinol monooxygenase YgiN